MNQRRTALLLVATFAMTSALLSSQLPTQAQAQQPTIAPKTKVEVKNAQELKMKRNLAWYNARQALDKLQASSLTYKLQLRRGSGHALLQYLPPANYPDRGLTAIREVMKACQVDFYVGNRRDYTVNVLDTKEVRPKSKAVEVACLDNACYKRYPQNNVMIFKGDIALTKGGDKSGDFAAALNSLRKHCWDFTKYDSQL